MAIVTKPHGDFVNNVDVANATYVDDQFNTLYNLVNGGLDGTNVPNLGDMTTVPTTAKKVADAITEIWNYPYSSVTRQAMINPSFSVNQRVVSGTVTLAAGAYGHDRWKAGAAGCTYTFATVNNVTTITITAGSLIQVIEGVNLFSGTYTLSWTGTAQGKIGAGAFGATGITGAATGGTNLSIEFNTGTLSKVQFNIGSIALPFQPRSFAEELALCQRYCYVISSNDASNTLVGTGNGLSTTLAGIYVDFPTTLRIAPSLSFDFPADWQLTDGVNAPILLSAISIFSGSNSKYSTEISATATGIAQYRPYFLSSVGTGRKIIFDAEL